MERDGVAADHRERRACVVELDQHIAEVFGELDHDPRRGAKRTGISERSYRGTGVPRETSSYA